MQKRAFLRAGLLATSAAIAATATTTQAATYLANADAEIREAQPEFTRGFGAAATGGQTAELQLSQIEQNRNLALVRFSVDPIWNSTNIGSASMRMFFRSGTNFGTADGASVRLYALNPTHALNSTWDEQTVIYRDAGIHQNTNATNSGLVAPSVISQPSIAGLSPESNDPPAPISGSATYGANPTRAERAPGITYENPPFSQQIENENQARYQYNLDQRALGAAGEAYLAYINQPAYGIRTIAGARPVSNAISTGDGDPFTTGDGYTNIDSDIPESNRPWDSGPTNSWLDDLEPTVWNLIGYSRFNGTSAAGNYVSIGDIDGFDNTPGTDESQIRQNLADFIRTWRDLGHSEFTFLLGRGTGTLDFNGDSVMDDVVQGGAVQFASKDLIPAGGAAGDYSPQLIINVPEPGSATFAILGLAGALGVRRRTR